MKNIQQKFDHRIFGMDILRILCALFIFLRHSHTMFGCRYGEIAEQIILDLTEPIMTCFFIVSGFSLYYVYGDKGDFTGQKLKKFYLKRAITILPSYYCVHVIYLLLHMEQRKEWVILTPIDLVGIQTFFNTLFGILHNGGSWFVSCIIVCYLLYPIMQMLVNETSVKWQITTLCMLHLLLVYSQYATSYFQLGNNYSNPLFRLLEFACGILAASILKTKSYKHMFECGGGSSLSFFYICNGRMWYC